MRRNACDPRFFTPFGVAETGRRGGLDANCSPRPSPFRPRRSVAPQGCTAEGGGSFAAPLGHALSVEVATAPKLPTASAAVQRPKKRPRITKRKFRRTPARKVEPISAAEKAMLLRSFTDDQIRQEKASRLLKIYTWQEIEAEAAKRGIR